MKRIISVIIIFYVCVPFAAGYIDPGTTGAIVGGSIWPFILMVFVAIGGFIVKYFWNPLKRAGIKLKSLFRR